MQIIAHRDLHCNQSYTPNNVFISQTLSSIKVLLRPKSKTSSNPLYFLFKQLGGLVVKFNQCVLRQSLMGARMTAFGYHKQLTARHIRRLISVLIQNGLIEYTHTKGRVKQVKLTELGRLAYEKIVLKKPCENQEKTKNVRCINIDILRSYFSERKEILININENCHFYDLYEKEKAKPIWQQFKPQNLFTKINLPQKTANILQKLSRHLRIPREVIQKSIDQVAKLSHVKNLGGYLRRVLMWNFNNHLSEMLERRATAMKAHEAETARSIMQDLGYSPSKTQAVTPKTQTNHSKNSSNPPKSNFYISPEKRSEIRDWAERKAYDKAKALGMVRSSTDYEQMRRFDAWLTCTALELERKAIDKIKNDQKENNE